MYVDMILKEGSAAAEDAPLIKNDQLVGVDSLPVTWKSFDEAIGAIGDSEAEKTKLTFFRGPADFLYGPTAPDADWYDELLK